MTPLTRYLWQVLALSALMFMPTLAHAQSGRAWMKGFIVGEKITSGISDATVTLTGDPDTARIRNVKLTAKTNDKGEYSLKEIPYGDYKLRVSAPGYVDYQIDIFMLLDAETKLHMKLKKEKTQAKEK